MTGQEIIDYIQDNNLQDSKAFVDVIEYFDGDHRVIEKEIRYLCKDEECKEVTYTDKAGRKRKKNVVDGFTIRAVV